MTDAAESIREFIFTSLNEMNYGTEDLDDDSELGPRGADLSSLALAELALRAEDEYSVKFTEEDAEEIAGMTIGELVGFVSKRVAETRATAQ